MIEVSHISKSFGSYRALDDISFTVENGSVYGLVGYNGAGKTTLLKIIAGVYRADAGTVTIDGAVFYAAGDTAHHALVLQRLLSGLVG